MELCVKNVAKGGIIATYISLIEWLNIGPPREILLGETKIFGPLKIW